MKTIKYLFFLGIMLSFQNAYSLCIGCGCQKAYNNCLDGGGADWCSQWPQNYTGTALENCCKDKRNDCHGTGFTIRIGFSLTNGILGNNEGGQELVPYHLLNSNQLAQIPNEMQVIINSYLNGNELTEEQWSYINSFDPE
jgi:hypothetical protein